MTTDNNGGIMPGRRGEGGEGWNLLIGKNRLSWVKTKV